MSSKVQKQLDPDFPIRQSHGVNVCGYLHTESGVGAVARGYVQALKSISIPIALHDLSSLCSNRAEDHSLLTSEASGLYDINLVCVDVEQHYAALAQMGEERFESCYNIGVWWWELMRFPAKWFDRFAYYDEIWVGTSFIANALAPGAPVPVVRVPPVLALDRLGSRDTGRTQIAVQENEFVFLFIFDFNSTYTRKNPLGVIDAFRQAFDPTDPVRLVIKCVNEHQNPTGFAELKSRVGDYPIRFYPGYWKAEEVRNLVAACDAYVSLHRAEGAGLPIADAMAHGKPVIATGWSGNMDFMNAFNSFPVKYDLVELQENAGLYQVGDIWAEPTIEHAAELMRHVYLHRSDAIACGLSARKTIERYYSVQEVGRIINHRLNAIATRRRIVAFREENKASYRRYRQHVVRVREAISRVAAPGVTIIVVSKGDDDLLRFSNHVGWHFPQAMDGTYAGSYPPDSTTAIMHFEELRSRGASFLVFPSIAFWWLEHYAGFQRHLARYRIVNSDEHCLIYSLRDDSGEQRK